MAQNTRRLQMRLNPEYQEEKDAIAIWDAQLAKGVDTRSLVCQALLAFKGKEVKPTGSNRDLVRRLNSIERKIDEQTTLLYEQIINALQSMDLSAYVNNETGRSMQQELGGKLPESAYRQVFETMQSESFDVD
jgi:hypothetical protein